MKEEPIFEIIIDGEVTEEITGWEKLDEVEAQYLDIFKKDGYEQIRFAMGGSQGYRLLFNEETLKTTTFAWREFTGFIDMAGDRVYYGDMLYNPNIDEKFSLNQYPEMACKNGYYTRSCDSWTEIPITANEIRKQYTVIHCVFPDIVNEKIKKNAKR